MIEILICLRPKMVPVYHAIINLVSIDRQTRIMICET